MKLNIQWKKVLYGIALIVIGIILAALHFIVAGKGIGFLVVALVAVGLACIQYVRRKRRIVTVIQ